jgi:L-lactate dehydrogenase
MRLPEIESPVQNISAHPSLEPRVPRIAIVGAGFVGSATAYALMMSGMAAEIVLTDRMFVGDFSDSCSADITIITAGVSQSGQKSRMEGLRDTGAILHGLVNDVCLQNPRGILLIASNPVDVLTYAAWRWSGLPAGRVIGSGTSLDTSRFRRRLAEHYGIASANVHLYVIGEHGDSQIPLLSSARVAGFPNYLQAVPAKMGKHEAAFEGQETTVLPGGPRNSRT